MNEKPWIIALFIILLAIIGIYAIMTGKCKEWLKYAVMVAEKELGSGTGQAKLRMVYDMFIDKYPAFSTIVPFAIFSKWVDLALEWLRIQLNSNVSLKSIVENQNG